MANREHQDQKFARIFAGLDEVRERVAKIEAREEHEKEQLAEVMKRLDEVRIQLAVLVGKESVRATISGVIGAAVSGVIVWLISLIGGK